jgi:DNA repair exonuclease SbcCD ATPase subunit
MEVSINKVTASGFLSIGDQVEYDIQDGITSIIGENQTDGFSTSNGSGKSALIEAIIWGLTGSTSRGIKNDEVVNLYYKGGCSVTIEVEIPPSIYEITRSRGHEKLGNSLTIVQDGEDISGNTATKSAEILAGILPFDFCDLTTMIVLSQGMPGKLSAQSPSGRKAILESIASYADKVEKLKEVVSNHKTFIEKEVATAQINRSGIEGRVNAMVDEVSRLAGDLQREVEEVAKYGEIADAIKKENEEIERKKVDASREYENLSTERTSLGDQVSDLRSKVNLIKSQISSVSSLRSSRQSDYTRLKNERDNAKRLVESYSVPSPVCPTCKQTIGDRSMVEQLKAVELEKATKAEESMTTIEIELKDLDAQVDDLKSRPAQDESDLNTLVASLASMDTRLATLRSLSMLSTKAIPEFHDRTSVIQSAIESKTLEIERLRVEIVNSGDIVDTLSRRLEVSKNIAYDVSRGEFRGFVLRKVIKKFNDLLGTVSEALMRDDVVKLEETENGGINIKYKEKRFEQMSGGERCRVDIALELTKRMYKSIVSGVRFNLLAMDEVTDGLDAFGISAIFDAVSVSNNVKSFFVISHRDDAVDYDRRFRVVKKDNMSKLYIE